METLTGSKAVFSYSRGQYYQCYHLVLLVLPTNDMEQSQRCVCLSVLTSKPFSGSQFKELSKIQIMLNIKCLEALDPVLVVVLFMSGNEKKILECDKTLQKKKKKKMLMNIKEYLINREFLESACKSHSFFVSF